SLASVFAASGFINRGPFSAKYSSAQAHFATSGIDSLIVFPISRVMILPSFSFSDRRIFAALWRNSLRLAGESSRHFSNAFLAFSTDFSTSVRVEARNLLSTLPLAGFTVSIHRLSLFAAKRIILGPKIQHGTLITYTEKLQLRTPGIRYTASQK